MDTHRLSRHGLEIQHFPAPDTDVVICRNPYSAIEELATTNIIRGQHSIIFPADGTTPQQWILSSYAAPAADGENPEPREDLRNTVFGPTVNTQGVREIEITLHNETTDPAAESSLLISAAPSSGSPIDLCTLVAKGNKSVTFRIPFRDPAAGTLDIETGLYVRSIPRIASIVLAVAKAEKAVINATLISR